MKINMTGLKTAVAGKCVGGLAVGMAAMIGMSPLTVLAQSKEAECICETKCTEDSINEECEICNYDWTYCEGEETEEDESWGPLAPDGNMNIVDDYGSLEAGGKQFITVTTKSGNYFYIIIDRDDEGNETVHFLNLVDESDLLALMDDDEVEEYMESIGLTVSDDATDTEVGETTEVEKEPETAETDDTETEVVEEKSTNVNGIMALVLVAAIGGIAGYFYFKSKKSKPNKPSSPDPDGDYDDDEEDYLDSLNDFIEDKEIAEEFDEAKSDSDTGEDE